MKWKRHHWTDDEKATIRRMYGTHQASEIAVALGMSPRAARAIYQQAMKLGLCKCPWHPPEVLDNIRQLHGEGLPDRVIAKRLGMTHDQIKDIRRERLKLACNPDIEGKRAAVRNQLRTLGLKSPKDLRSRAWRNFAIASGWPEDLVPREVQILNVFARTGKAMTRLQLAAAIGMRTDREDRPGQLALLTGNGPGGTYTASLMRRGLIVRLKRYRGGRAKRCQLPSLYLLGPVALAILSDRARKESKHAK